MDCLLEFERIFINENYSWWPLVVECMGAIYWNLLNFKAFFEEKI